MDHFGLEHPDGRLRQRVVKGVADCAIDFVDVSIELRGQGQQGHSSGIKPGALQPNEYPMSPFLMAFEWPGRGGASKLTTMSLRSWWRGDASHWQRTGVLVGVAGLITAVVYGSGLLASNFDIPSVSEAEQNSGAAGGLEQIDPLDPLRSYCPRAGPQDEEWTLSAFEVGRATVPLGLACEVWEEGYYELEPAFLEYFVPRGAKTLIVHAGIEDSIQRPSAHASLRVVDTVANKTLAIEPVQYGQSPAKVQVPVSKVQRVGFEFSLTDAKNDATRSVWTRCGSSLVHQE